MTQEATTQEATTQDVSTPYPPLLENHDHQAVPEAMLADKKESPVVDLQTIDSLLQTNGNSGVAKKRRDAGRHKLMAAAETERDWQDVANHIAKNLGDIRPGIYKRFQDCPFQTASDFVWWHIHAQTLLAESEDLNKAVLKHFYNLCPDQKLVDDFKWHIHAKTLLADFEDLNKAVLEHFYNLCPDQGLVDDFKKLLADRAETALASVDVLESKDIAHMHWVIDGRGVTEEVKELFGKFREKFEGLPKSVAKRLGMLREDDSVSLPSFSTSTLPAFLLKNPPKPPQKSIEKMVEEGWEITRDDDRQVILTREVDGRPQTVTRYRRGAKSKLSRAELDAKKTARSEADRARNPKTKGKGDDNKKGKNKKK